MDEQTTETSSSISVDGTEVPAIGETSEQAEKVTETSTETSVPDIANEPYVTDTTVTYVDIYESYQFYSMMYNSFEEFRFDSTEQNELIVSDMNRLAQEIEEYQLSTMIVDMLTCGLLGIIIGVCLVNIFKKR